jgi:hypothetical protein
MKRCFQNDFSPYCRDSFAYPFGPAATGPAADCVFFKSEKVQKDYMPAFSNCQINLWQAQKEYRHRSRFAPGGRKRRGLRRIKTIRVLLTAVS